MDSSFDNEILHESNEVMARKLKHAEHELARVKDSARFLLSMKVYDLLAELSQEDCIPSRIFSGKCPDTYPDAESKWCSICRIKKLEPRVREDVVRADWHNIADDLDTYWQALYAIRCAAEHLDLPGKKVNARRRQEVLAKMVISFENIHKIANEAIQSVKGSGR